MFERNGMIERKKTFLNLLQFKQFHLKTKSVVKCRLNSPVSSFIHSYDGWPAYRHTHTFIRLFRRQVCPSLRERNQSVNRVTLQLVTKVSHKIHFYPDSNG